LHSSGPRTALAAPERRRPLPYKRKPVPVNLIFAQGNARGCDPGHVAKTGHRLNILWGWITNIELLAVVIVYSQCDVAFSTLPKRCGL
jgi:hypothetical protein